MIYDNLLYSVEAGVAHVVLNRPEKRNAIDRAMIDDLHRAMDALETDETVRVAILSGAGGKAFAAGADIAQLRERKAAQALQIINARLFQRVEDLPCPTIAAITGYALGGGCELAMACDLRVAGMSAKLGQPEVALGIIPAAGGTQRLPRLVGLGRARDIIFTGRIVEAAEAERIGLVNRLVADENVLEAAEELAAQIARQGGLAVRLAKLALNTSSRTGHQTGALVEQLAQAVLFESQDKLDRMGAFLERKEERRREKEEKSA
jgi:enoyl-CoA hydratase/carnithine racemase